MDADIEDDSPTMMQRRPPASDEGDAERDLQGWALGVLGELELGGEWEAAATR